MSKVAIFLVWLMLSASYALPQASKPTGTGSARTASLGSPSSFPVGSDDGYLAPAICTSCHQEIAKTYLHTGMGRSFSRMRPQEVQADFAKNNTFYHRASNRQYTVYKSDGKYYLRRHQVGTDGKEINVVKKEIHYVLGSGNHARSYLHRTPQGRFLQLPLTWYSREGGFWAMAPGYDRPDHAGFRREIDFECIFCHNGYPEVEPGSDREGFSARFPSYVPEGIDCQRCHGPGREHVRAAQRGDAQRKVQQTILNPARLNIERQSEICMQCHLETTTRSLPHAIRRYGRGFFSYRPSEPLGDYVLHFDHAPGSKYDDKFEVVSAVYRLRKSACFTRSSGSLTCTTCHDPHYAPRGAEAAKRYSAICQSCHGDQATELAAGKHPVAAECISCHMPKVRTEDAVHVAMTDHLIQRERRSSPSLSSRRSRNSQKPYRGEVALYYPPRLPNEDEAELYLGVAQVKDESNLIPGIVRLRKAIEDAKPGHAEFYFELAQAYHKAGQNSAALPYYEKAVERDPRFWRARWGLGRTLLELESLERAAKELQAAISSAPREPELWLLLGEVYYQQANLNEAVSALRQAEARNPDLPEIHSNLGTTYAAQGKNVAAEAELREAIRLRPDFAVAHNNLANVLIRVGRPSEAAYHFETAIQIDPAYADARENYALTLTRLGRGDEAKAQIKAALKQEPQRASLQRTMGFVLFANGEARSSLPHYESALKLDSGSVQAHMGMAVSLLELNNIPKAINHLRITLEIDPHFFEAHLRLGLVLLQEERVAEAQHHLRKAAESSNPRIRQKAQYELSQVNKESQITR